MSSKFTCKPVSKDTRQRLKFIKAATRIDSNAELFEYMVLATAAEIHAQIKQIEEIQAKAAEEGESDDEGNAEETNEG